jgi:hypothetical protein
MALHWVHLNHQPLPGLCHPSSSPQFSKGWGLCLSKARSPHSPPTPVCCSAFPLMLLYHTGACAPIWVPICYHLCTLPNTSLFQKFHFHSSRPVPNSKHPQRRDGTQFIPVPSSFYRPGSQCVMITRTFPPARMPKILLCPQCPVTIHIQIVQCLCPAVRVLCAPHILQYLQCPHEVQLCWPPGPSWSSWGCIRLMMCQVYTARAGVKYRCMTLAGTLDHCSGLLIKSLPLSDFNFLNFSQLPKGWLCFRLLSSPQIPTPGRLLSGTSFMGMMAFFFPPLLGLSIYS